MKKYIPWLKAMRLTVTIPAGMLVHIGFKLAGKPTDWLLVIWIFIGASLAMLHNDYVDREHDLKKNRTFACENAFDLKNILIAGWTILFFGSLTFFAPYASLLLPVILISILYSYCREIPVVQTICVAFASASPVIMTASSINVLGSINPNSVFFFVVFFAIYGREMIKDIEDVSIDVGYKATLVSTGMQTIPVAYKEASFSIAVSLLILIFETMTRIPHPSIALAMTFFTGWIFCMFAVLAWTIDHSTLIGKRCFDIGMIIVLLSMIIF